MGTLVEYARSGKITEEMEYVAACEEVDPEVVRRGLADGRIVIPLNQRRGIDPMGIGEGLSVKVNANIGTSQDICEPDLELEKARAAAGAGADTLMDLSTGGDIDGIRRRILEECRVPLGTVPIYQAAIEAQKRSGAVIDMTEDDIFNVIERQAKDGVDFITVHCGVNKEVVDIIRKQERLMGVVSRGGTFHAARILHSGEENPLYSSYDYLLELAKRYDVTLSLGDGMRPGCIHDASDRLQIQELTTIGRLVQRARKAGVQAIVEGPGHIPMDQVEANVVLQKTLCDGAPFYVLGPLVTDVAPGYDHIAGAIGGALAAKAGADFLCYLTPAEHIGLPDLEDVRTGVVASKLAAHIGDMYRKKGSKEWDHQMSKARNQLDWKKQIELSIDPEKTERLRRNKAPRDGENQGCSMCGDYCAIKILRENLEKEQNS